MPIPKRLEKNIPQCPPAPPCPNFRSLASAPGSVRTSIQEAYGQWFVYDHVLQRIICMSTHETDALVISESVNKWCKKFSKEKAQNTQLSGSQSPLK